MTTVQHITAVVTDWSHRTSAIRSLALVGSHARGEARPDSDIDFVILTPTARVFRESSGWMDEMNWAGQGNSVAHWRDESYGVAWSRHVSLADGTELEFCFAGPEWASTSPIDVGTLRVIAGGFRVLHDPDRHLEKLLLSVSAFSPPCPVTGSAFGLTSSP